VARMGGPAVVDGGHHRRRRIVGHVGAAAHRGRYLLAAKLTGQAGVLRDILHEPGTAVMVDDLAAELKGSAELDMLRIWARTT
jgi:hypothetical protein